MALRVACLVVVLTMGLEGVLHAQVTPVRFEYIDSEAGLSHNHVQSVFQDREGFLWVGTLEGLNRYDGLTVEPDSTVADIVIDPDTVTVPVEGVQEFVAFGFEEAGFTLPFTPLWRTDGSEIDEAGVFSAGNATGTFTITATDTVFGVQSQAHVIVLDATVTAVEEHEDLPETFVLHVNYPNPFNPTTTIPYQIPVASRVTLAVYDVLGRRVATLVDAEQAAGRHQVGWRADRFASGVYFVRMVAEARSGGHRPFIAMQKVVLVK